MRAISTETPVVPRGFALATVLLVLFLTFLDTTIVTVALGNIQFDLGAGVIPLQWVVNAYSLVFASLMLTAGTLGDRFGRKWMMLAGIAIFCAGSVLCALAPTVNVLIGGRAVMGVGAAASEPGTLSVLRHLYPQRASRARAIGAWAAVSGLALALGPVIGGLLVGWGSWRTVFWFNLVLGAVLLAATARLVPNSSDPQPGRVDIAGFVLGSAALGCVIYAGISGERSGYAHARIIELFVAGGLAFIAFAATERRARSPMVDLRYLGGRAVGTALFVAFAVYFGVFSIFFFTALYVDLVVGYSGWQLAGLFAPMAAAIVIGSVVAGYRVAQIGPRGPMLFGCVLSAAGILLTRHDLSVHPAFGELAAVLALTGAGFGLAVVPLTVAVLGHVPAAHSGMAASATNTARQVGAVVGVAVLGSLVNARISKDFGDTLTRGGATGSGKNFIVDLLETGGKDAAGIDIAHPSPVIKPLVDAATGAFRNGLHDALFLSAMLILIAALATALLPRWAMDSASEVD